MQYMQYMYSKRNDHFHGVKVLHVTLIDLLLKSCYCISTMLSCDYGDGDKVVKLMVIWTMYSNHTCITLQFTRTCLSIFIESYAMPSQRRRSPTLTHLYEQYMPDTPNSSFPEEDVTIERELDHRASVRKVCKTSHCICQTIHLYMYDHSLPTQM